MKKPSPDSKAVKVCGLGAVPARDATLEALEALRSCRTVFSDLADPGSFAWLGGLCALRRARGAEEIVKAAQAAGPVGLAVWGHPLVNSALAREVLARARRQKLTCEVFAGASPIGAVLAREVAFFGGEEGCKGARACSVAAALAEPALLDSELPVIAYSEDGRGWDKLARALAPRLGRVLLAFYALPAFSKSLVTLEELPEAARRGGALVVSTFGKSYAG